MASAITFGDDNCGFQAGVINGPVTTNFHHHAPPGIPSAVIPFNRDEDFVEQGILLHQVHQKCARPGSRTALVGLGGIGKSQIAIEHAYRTRERSPETWVFWVHASNRARFEQSFRDIANYVKISGRQNRQANIFQLVYDWLRDERKGNWILILDNVDDAGFLVDFQSASQDRQTNSLDSGNSKSLVSYLPQCQNGSILITTRSRDVALRLVENRDIILVEPMATTDALALLNKNLGTQGSNNELTELVTSLEFIPLAIVQATAYISQRAPRYSVGQYLKEFQKSDHKRASLLEYEGGQLRRDREAKNSVIITWQLSFDHIRRIRPSAADLLSLMSFFDRQGIPEALLRNYNRPECTQQVRNESNDDKLGKDDSDDSGDCSSQYSISAEFEDDIVTLRNYSFVTISVNSTIFEMHGLVQLAMRSWLKANDQQRKWEQQFISVICAELPTGEYENWERCEALFPHAKSAAALRPENQDSVRDWASILHNAAWYALRMGNGVEAEKMSVQAVKARKKILGREDKDTLNSIEMVGLASELRGQWDTAEKQFVQVMETRKTKLGADHPDTLTSRANLASTYRKQGHWEKAEELQVQVIETRKTKLGADHPDTLTSMANLASTFWKQGHWDKAEELQVQVMETRKTKLGADHPDTLTSMGNLALTWKDQDRQADAFALLRDCAQAQHRVLGPRHPHTLYSLAVMESWSS
ncbi:P-loop containing nucleoside triphosphate hydrolase protein [Pseudomassariella vexata]|uniref:p-loop containing nucleoside triphosphate hydrolase protein n=1 Tax=Pseudomassariella vexata TaxID=1141098 RepID=A0A1Y2E3V3_9PEZI|nr:P-loop containing nucleoside triphosphate hydrolase protein [Pseudomassariella vexata]ORY66127.1 P-loop containing nucleoside triphosphate hydrolase protein [Pseudomassariella vexata]